jgi:hypothetical protein
VTRARRLAAALALVLGAAPATARAADDAAAYAALLEQRAPAIVTVKFVVKMRSPAGDRESNADARGVVVDPTGLVMIAADALEPSAGVMRMLQRRGGGGDLGFTPSDLKVLFGSDAKEHPAVLVAKESKLGLAFLQIVAVEGAPAAVDLGKAVEPKVGQTVVGVGRKSRGFDAAPVLERGFVTGRLEKPRPLWALVGGLTAGLPLYHLDGAVAGVVVHQSGVEGADDAAAGGLAALLGGGDAYLLPADAVVKTLAQVKARVPAALEKARAEKPADAPSTPPDAPATTPTPGMGEPGMDDAPMDEPKTPAPGQDK